MTQRILISTGGSGGHVVPATILYEHLKDKFHVSMSSDYRGIKFLDKNKYNLKIFNISPISENIFLLPFKRDFIYIPRDIEFIDLMDLFLIQFSS